MAGSHFMADDRATQLSRKLEAAIITAAEERELESLYPTCHRCPLCGGSFRLTEYKVNGGRCSQCDTELHQFCSDCPGHAFHEIVPSIPSEEMFGAFCVVYLPTCVNWCAMCVKKYPRTYTCFPGLIETAVRLHQVHRAKHGSAAISFLDTHAATLCNMLRGTFTFEPRTLRYFKKRVIPLVARKAELMRILD